MEANNRKMVDKMWGEGNQSGCLMGIMLYKIKFWRSLQTQCLSLTIKLRE